MCYETEKNKRLVIWKSWLRHHGIDIGINTVFYKLKSGEKVGNNKKNQPSLRNASN